MNSLPLILGALITILSLGVDPFVQQIISFRVEPSIDRASQSTVPFAQRYSKGMVHVSSYRVPGQTLVDDILTIDYPMIAAISQGLSQDVDTLQKQVPFTCTSGNCTWPSYTSLSVCSACNDVTSLLQKTEMNSKWPQWKNFLNITNDTLINGWTTALPATKYNLSDGNELWNANNVHELFAVAMTAHATFGPPETVSFQEDDLLFFAMSVIHANFTTSIGSTLSSWPESPVSATECALSFCVKQFNSSVQNGEFSEKVTVLQSVRSNNSWLASSSDSIKSNATDPSFDGPDSSLQVPIRTDLQLILSENQTQRFNVSQESIDGLAPYFNSLFDPSNNAVLLSNQSNMTAEDIGSRTTTNVNPLSSYMKLFWDSPNVTALFDNIATAMTNEMRRSDDNRTVMYGDTVVNETLIHVDWRWAILPIALGLLGCLFLSISIWETRRTRTAIWKESSLAILYHGIDRQLLQLSNGLTVYEMQKAAEQCRAQLLEIGDRLKLGMFPGLDLRKDTDILQRHHLVLMSHLSLNMHYQSILNPRLL